MPLLRLLGNFTPVAYNLDVTNNHRKEEVGCQGCEMLRNATDVREVDGHLVALDPDFIADSHVRDWMSKGAKYRLNRHPKGVMVAVREGLAQYVELYIKAFKCDLEQVEKLEKWKNLVIELTQQNLGELHKNSHQEARQNEEMKNSVQQIQEHLVVVPVDKAGHNIAFICQAWYVQKLKDELTNENGAY